MQSGQEVPCICSVSITRIDNALDGGLTTSSGKLEDMLASLRL